MREWIGMGCFYDLTEEQTLGRHRRSGKSMLKGMVIYLEGKELFGKHMTSRIPYRSLDL